MFRVELIMYANDNHDFLRLTIITWKENHMKKISWFLIHITVHVLGS